MMELELISNAKCAYSLSNLAFYQLYCTNDFLFPELHVRSILDYRDIFDVEMFGSKESCANAIYIHRKVWERIGEIENEQNSTQNG